jgi:hypothetical protein
MKTRSKLLAATLLCGLALGCAPEVSDDALVARVGPYTLSIDDVADLLVNEERFPAQVAVVEQITDLWIEYVRLAAAAADDSTFASIDFEPLVRQQYEQYMIFQLRDSVVQVDTMITDAELRSLYEADNPALQIRARHLLLAYPPNPTDASRNAVRSQIEALRARILNGERFQALAQQYSADPGTASLGGDLGFFGRGDMLAQIEEAALELDIGQVSDPVESPYGLHLIKLEERRAQGFEEIASNFRAQVLTQRYLAAESTFIAGVENGAAAEPAEGAYALVREMAGQPQSRLSGRAATRSVFDYEGGKLTVSELRFVLQGQEPAFLAQVAIGDDDQIDAFLRSLVQRELLTEQAQSAGFEPSPERLDSLVTDARLQLKRAAITLGLLRLERAPGEPLAQAVSRGARKAVEKVVTGATDMIRLGAVNFQLRQGDAEMVFDRGIGSAILRIGQLRANRSASLFEEADSAGRNP